MIPNKATGAGNVDATMVLRAIFSQELSAAPRIEAYDNSEIFPAVGTPSTTLKEIFTGTTENGNKPFLAGYIGGKSTNATTPGANWHPSSATAGGANPNLLKGTTNYVKTTVIPELGEDIVFNLSLKVPSDAAVPSASSMNAMIVIRCNYTGEEPAITLEFNEGTEETPNWTELTPGTHGGRFSNSGTESGGPYKVSLAESGSVDAGELWITE